MKKLLALLGLVSVVGLTGCATQPSPPPLIELPNTHSILVLPVVNESAEATAGDLMFVMSGMPWAEHGYYAYPALTTKMVLASEALYEPELAQKVPVQKYCDLFGTDAVLKIQVKQFDAEFKIIMTHRVADASYQLLNCQGQVLWSDFLHYQIQDSDNSSVFSSIFVAALSRAFHNLRPLARQMSDDVPMKFVPGPNIKP